MLTCYVDIATRSIVDLVQPGELTGDWTITRINVPKLHRGQGWGHTMLLRVLRDADEDQVALQLEINPSDGLDFKELRAWYERHGFREMQSGYFRRAPIRKAFRDTQRAPEEAQNGTI